MKIVKNFGILNIKEMGIKKNKNCRRCENNFDNKLSQARGIKIDDIEKNRALECYDSYRVKVIK